ncbi:hypothetical protein MKW94_028602 [Papaver nudicaule]|uniref:Dirigent protein n=1 Tax=Papaver nudicaule TaxID=74823 RepID=A0AA42B3Q1_PAPNU|nr:hypothetical protein [Papaver nudicaule]
MSFYMDNILDGLNAPTQAVTGVVSNQVINDHVPLSKSNGTVQPGNSGVPLKNANYRIIENKNLPLLTVLNGTTNSVIQKNTKNMDSGGEELTFGKTAHLSLHKVMRAWFRFGWKGTRILCVSESQLAIMGGTGKYINARGFATIKAFPSTSHTTANEDKTVLHFSVFLA